MVTIPCDSDNIIVVLLVLHLELRRGKVVVERGLFVQLLDVPQAVLQTTAAVVIGRGVVGPIGTPATPAMVVV